MLDAERLVADVKDAASFLEFAQALSNEWQQDAAAEQGNPSSVYGPTRAGWENTSLERFLAAAVAWAKDGSFIDSDENPWRLCAQFLLAGKSYE